MNVDPTPQLDPKDAVPDKGGFATLEETRKAVEGLTDADVARLMVAAKYFWKRRIRGVRDGWQLPEELLHEAVLRTLEGARRWHKSVATIVQHLRRTMESISSHIAAKRHSDNLRLVKEPVEDIERVDYGETDGGASRVAEIAAARDEARFIEGLFEDDELALELLWHRRDGFSASETRSELGITKKQYEAGWKRIRRKLAEYVKDDEEAR